MFFFPSFVFPGVCLWYRAQLYDSVTDQVTITIDALKNVMQHGHSTPIRWDESAMSVVHFGASILHNLHHGVLAIRRVPNNCAEVRTYRIDA